MGYDAAATIPGTSATAAALAPTGLYVGIDRDHSPYRPPTAPRKGWRIPIGAPVSAIPPVATASAATVAPSVAVSLASLTVPIIEADAAALGPVISTNFQSFPPTSAAATDTAGPELVLAATPDLAGADATGIAPPTLYVGPDLYPVYVTGTAAASTDGIAPTLALGSSVAPDVATASAATVAPSAAIPVLYKTGASSNGSTSITLPSHSVGDLLVMYAYNASNTAPTIPSGWTSIVSDTFTNNVACSVAYQVGTSTTVSTLSSGTWTGGNRLMVAVLTGQSASPIGGAAIGKGPSSTTVTAPSVTLSNTTGRSVLLHFFGISNNANYGTVASGYTERLTATNRLRLTTKDSTTTDGALPYTLDSAAAYATATIEII